MANWTVEGVPMTKEEKPKPLEYHRSWLRANVISKCQFNFTSIQKNPNQSVGIIPKVLRWRNWDRRRLDFNCGREGWSSTMRFFSNKYVAEK